MADEQKVKKLEGVINKNAKDTENRIRELA